MFDKIFKKKTIKPGTPGKDKEDNEEEVEAPDVDETLSDLDAALAKTEALKKAQAREDKRRAAEEELERQYLRDLERRGGGSCGCF